MNRFFLGILVIFSLCICLPVFAETTATLGGQDADGDYYWSVDHNGNLTGLSGGATLTLTGVTITGTGVITATHIADVERSIPLPIGEMYIAGNVPRPITTSTNPGLVIDNELVAIVWDDSETTPVQMIFRIPAAYSSGGAFRLFCSSTDDTTPTEVDYAVYINGDNVTFDSSATNQTPVALTRGEDTPEIVILSVTTDFASLSEGDLITLEVWRDDTSTGTGDLKLYYAEFYETDSQ